jgi:hypothetical protein
MIILIICSIPGLISYFIFMQDSELSSPVCEPVSESNCNESRLQPTQQGRSIDYRKNEELDEYFFLYRRKQQMRLEGEGNKQEMFVFCCV